MILSCPNSQLITAVENTNAVAISSSVSAQLNRLLNIETDRQAKLCSDMNSNRPHQYAQRVGDAAKYWLLLVVRTKPHNYFLKRTHDWLTSKAHEPRSNTSSQ